MKNNIFVIIFLLAGTLLTIVVTTLVSAAYADDGNTNKAEDNAISQLNDCDDNELATNALLNCEMIDTINN